MPPDPAGRAIRAFGVAVLIAAAGCMTSYTTLVQDRDTATLLAPSRHILDGHHDGSASVASYKAAGNFGIGTFDGLDGEAVLLDSVVYQIKGDGSVRVPDDTLGMPFGICTLFDDDIHHKMRNIDSFAHFGQALESVFTDKHIFYAVKVSGQFKTMRVGSQDKQRKPYRPLHEAPPKQHERIYADTRGTLVGFWIPPSVPSAIAEPGFHLHYISKDRTHGGHVLDFQAHELDIVLDPTPRVTIDFSAPPAKEG